ncbi:MAG: hypothetical protein ABII03_05670 [Nanoarchaeota archaeon]|nr:hypothetical protein [Nanoarchaeota archaeon]
MEQRQIKSRVRMFVMFGIMASLLTRILFMSFGFKSVGAWIVVSLIITILLVLAFILIIFLRRESDILPALKG